jgi:hypothetical protein
VPLACSFFPSSDLSLCLCSLGCKCPCLLRFFSCYNLSLHLHSAVGECPLLAQILYIFQHVPLSALFRMCVPLACSGSFHVLTYPLHLYSAVGRYPLPHRFFLCSNLSLYLHSSVCECPLLTWMLSKSWFVPLFALPSLWVPLVFLDSFCVLTCPSIYALQGVSAPHLPGFFLSPDMFPCLCS